MRVGLGEAGFGNVTALGWEATEDDIPEVAQRLIGYVDEVIASSGAARVHLVGHSMGGVIIRYAIEVLGLGSRVALVAYVAAPHGGSLGAHIGHLTGRRGRASRQCAPGSALLRQVEAAATRNVTADPVWRPIDVISLYSDADAVVTARSAQIRTGSARNVLIQGSGHIGIIMNMRTILTIVTAARIADSPTPDNHARRSA
jgi:pimeloyl-ACP methyl ester carboxylesterase